MRILIDTSSILFALSNMKNVFQIISDRFPKQEMVISKGVVNELERLAKEKGNRAKLARTALMEIGSTALKIEENELNVDRWIENAAKDAGGRECVVCTNDINLKKKVRMHGIKVFSATRSGTLR